METANAVRGAFGGRRVVADITHAGTSAADERGSETSETESTLRAWGRGKKKPETTAKICFDAKCFARIGTRW